MTKKGLAERGLEGWIFGSRWLMAPFYLGMTFALVLLLVAFARDLVELAPQVFNPSSEHIIVGVLTLIELSLAGNLVIMIMFSGYENFVSRIDTGESEDRPSWMGTLDFSGLKMKVIGSIVAISIISLLRAFMVLSLSQGPFDSTRLKWMLVLHISFVTSGLMFALMDWVACRAAHPRKRGD